MDEFRDYLLDAKETIKEEARLKKEMIEEAKAVVGEPRRNIMNTLSVELKISGMRKPQDFIFYPMQTGEKNAKIQSDTRIGLLNMDTGKGQMSKSHSSGAYFLHLQTDKLIDFEISSADMSKIKKALSKTSTVSKTGVIKVIG